jgi:ATP-dependent DNA helicase RecQ
MAKSKPRNEREILSITGVGDHKLRKYGAQFLAAIEEHRLKSAPGGDIEALSVTLSDTQKDTFQLYQQGLSLPEIASIRGLKELTIVSHLEELAAAGADIDLRRFVVGEKIPLIEARLEELGTVSLTALKEGLPGSISYCDLRLVRGAWGRERQC